MRLMPPTLAVVAAVLIVAAVIVGSVSLGASSTVLLVVALGQTAMDDQRRAPRR